MIQTTDELHRAMQGHMKTGYYDRRDRQRNRDTLVKSYLLEIHHQPNGNLAHSIEASFEKVNRSLDLQVVELEDPNLVGWKFTSNAGREVDFYVQPERGSTRFFRCHSMDHADVAEGAINRITNSGAHIDRLWFPSEFLRKMSGWEGDFLGLKTYVVTVKEAGTALTPREIVHREKANLQGTLGTP